MRPQNWQGTDVSLATSLHEYGFIACKNEHCEENQLFVLYKTYYKDDEGKDLFDTCYISETELNDLVLEKDWIDAGDINNFLSTFGMTVSEWMELPFTMKISDMKDYWGNENIFGTPYGAIPLEQFRFYIPSECFEY